MAWTAPRTWTTGELVTAAIMNTHVRDNLLETASAKVTTAGDIVYATAANALARLGIGAAGQLPFVNSGATALAYNSFESCGANNLTGGQVIPDSTVTAITFDSEDWDNASMHDNVTNKSRITAPVAGIYIGAFYVTFDPNSTGDRRAMLRVNNDAIWLSQLENSPSGSEVTVLAACGLVKLAANDYVELQVAQTSGGNLNTQPIGYGLGSPRLSLTRISQA